MSGLEIAGLVLGALPLAIEVLDRYSEVADRIDVFFKIKAEYDEWHRRLEFNHLLFKRNVEELLLPLMVDDITKEDNIPKLMKDPFGSWWTEPEMAHLLQERLRDGYKVYMGCIQDIEQVMEDIVRELALGHAAVQSKIASPVSPWPPIDRDMLSIIRLAIDINHVPPGGSHNNCKFEGTERQRQPGLPKVQVQVRPQGPKEANPPFYQVGRTEQKTPKDPQG